MQETHAKQASADASMGLLHTTAARRFLKVAIFLIACLMMLVTITHLLTPAYTERDGIRGFYSQPNDSVEVAFMGASTYLCGFAPNRLYEETGISSYVMATSNQPYVSTYYLFEDMLQTQGKSLKVVMIDPTPLVKKPKGSKSSSNAIKVLTYMRPSIVKMQYAWSLSRMYRDVRFLEALIPLLRYHSRWNSFSDYDMDHLFPTEQGVFAHGQLIYWKSFSSNRSFGRAGKYTEANVIKITTQREADKGTLEERLNAEDAEYLERILQSCKDRGIQAVVVKTPASNWGDLDHDAVALFAETHDVEFLDMNLAPIWNQLGLSYDDDYRDAKHMNVSGSVKTTDYIGTYLEEKYGLAESSGQLKKTGFQESELTRFHECQQDMLLSDCENLEEYLSLLDNERYTVFLNCYADSIAGLSKTSRAKMSEMGLEELAGIEAGIPYVGVLDAGQCVSEVGGEPDKAARLKGAYKDGVAIIDRTSKQSGAKLRNAFNLVSEVSGNGGSCTISLNGDSVIDANGGLCLAVYDRKSGYLIDKLVFDISSEKCPRLLVVDGDE